MDDRELERLTLQAYDDLHRIAAALEKMSVERLIGERVIERLAETILHVVDDARKLQ